MSTVIEGVYRKAGEPDKLLPLVADESGKLSVVAASNIKTKFREAFEDYSPNSPTSNWIEIKADGDITIADGNAVAASYLVISKSVWNAGSSTVIETRGRFSMPFDCSVGLHTSQRTVGQEFAIDFVDDDLIPTNTQLTISNISQTTTTLTITTVEPHGLVAGKRFQIAGCSDNRLNYPALVVATTPNPNLFTATAGPAGTIPSLTASATTGFVFPRPSLGYASNGTTMVLENATATNASFYIRSAEGDSLPSGTATGNHSVTTLTSASVQAINTAHTYAFQPSTEYRLALQADRVQWSNVAIDSLVQSTNLTNRTQVVPDASKSYKLRIRATNAQDLTRPIGKIISAVKSGSTTATITLDRDHGLAVGALVTVYGIRDQATAFPNVTTATAITGVPASNQIQLAIGTGTSNTSYGGFVAVVNGGNLPSALGAASQVVQSAALSTMTDGTRQLILVGNVNWASPVATVGDYVELIGLRNNINGADLGVDGAWKIASVATTTLTLVPVQADTVLPPDFTTTECGGGVMRRTDLRISFVRVFDFERERVELLARPSGDLSSAAPVTVQGTATVGGSVTTTAASAVLMGDVAQQYRATASGASATHLVSAATTNSTLVKSSAGKVLGWYFANTTASWIYVKLHNQTTAPTAGTGVVRTIAVPPNGISQFFSEGGITFATGIGMTVVAGIADSDNTAITASALVGELIWA